MFLQCLCVFGSGERGSKKLHCLQKQSLSGRRAVAGPECLPLPYSGWWSPVASPDRPGVRLPPELTGTSLEAGPGLAWRSVNQGVC